MASPSPNVEVGDVVSYKDLRPGDLIENMARRAKVPFGVVVHIGSMGIGVEDSVWAFWVRVKDTAIKYYLEYPEDQFIPRAKGGKLGQWTGHLRQYKLLQRGIQRPGIPAPIPAPAIPDIPDVDPMDYFNQYFIWVLKIFHAGTAGIARSEMIKKWAAVDGIQGDNLEAGIKAANRFNIGTLPAMDDKGNWMLMVISVFTSRIKPTVSKTIYPLSPDWEAVMFSGRPIVAVRALKHPSVTNFLFPFQPGGGNIGVQAEEWWNVNEDLFIIGEEKEEEEEEEEEDDEEEDEAEEKKEEKEEEEAEEEEKREKKDEEEEKEEEDEDEEEEEDKGDKKEDEEEDEDEEEEEEDEDEEGEPDEGEPGEGEDGERGLPGQDGKGKGDGGDGGDGEPGQPGGDGGDGGPEGGNGGDGGDGGEDADGGDGGDGRGEGDGGDGGDGSGEHGKGGDGGRGGEDGGKGGDGGDGGPEGGDGGDGGKGSNGGDGGDGGDGKGPGSKGGKGGKGGPGGKDGKDGKDGPPMPGEGEPSEGEPQYETPAPTPRRPMGDQRFDNLRPGDLIYDEESQRYTVVHHIGPIGTVGDETSVWGIYKVTKEEAEEAYIAAPPTALKSYKSGYFIFHSGEGPYYTIIKRGIPVKNPVAKNLTAPPDAPTAFRDMFLFFKGRVTDKDIKAALKSWPRFYGKGNVQRAWKDLKEDGFVVQKGKVWEWPMMLEAEKIPVVNPTDRENAAKKTVERFTWMPARRVKTVSMPALDQKARKIATFKTLMYESNKRLDNPRGTLKLYYHPWEDGHERCVCITEDGKYIIARGQAVVKKEGIDDLPVGFRYFRKMSEVQAVPVWGRLATLIRVDLPCIKQDGGTLRFIPSKGWRCDVCGGRVSLYKMKRGMVLYDEKSRIVLCISKVG